jgi:hypothetical protein
MVTSCGSQGSRASSFHEARRPKKPRRRLRVLRWRAARVHDGARARLCDGSIDDLDQVPRLARHEQQQTWTGLGIAALPVEHPNDVDRGDDGEGATNVKWPVGTIASQLHIHHSTVRRVLIQAGLVGAEAMSRPSIVDAFVPFIKQTLTQYPRLRASRLCRTQVSP